MFVPSSHVDLNVAALHAMDPAGRDLKEGESAGPSRRAVLFTFEMAYGDGLGNLSMRLAAALIETKVIKRDGDVDYEVRASPCLLVLPTFLTGFFWPFFLTCVCQQHGGPKLDRNRVVLVRASGWQEGGEPRTLDQPAHGSATVGNFLVYPGRCVCESSCQPVLAHFH